MLASLFAAHLAIAPPERPLLEWVAPGSCADQQAVDDRLQQLIPGEGAESLSARAVVTKAGTRHRMRVELVSATGTSVRELESESCAVLAEAAVFIVAVAIDPAVVGTAMREEPVVATVDGSVEEPAPPPEESIAPTHEPAVAPRVEAPAPTSPRVEPRRDRVGGAVRAGLGVGTFEISRFDLAPSITGAIRGRYWRSELGLRYVVGRDETITRDAALALDAFGGVARGCGVAPAGPLEIPVCAGLDLAGVRARPHGLMDQHRRLALRVAIDLAVAIAWPITRRVALWVEAAGGVAVFRPNFSVRGIEGTRVGPPASFSAVVGVELRIPGRVR
jgi:hypothetical protein